MDRDAFHEVMRELVALFRKRYEPALDVLQWLADGENWSEAVAAYGGPDGDAAQAIRNFGVITRDHVLPEGLAWYLRRAVHGERAGPTSRYHFVPGSYGGRGAFMPSIACEREQGEGARAVHFVLVKQEPSEDGNGAAAIAESDLDAAFAARAGDPVAPERVAAHLRNAGYVAVDDPRIAAD